MMAGCGSWLRRRVLPLSRRWCSSPSSPAGLGSGSATAAALSRVAPLRCPPPCSRGAATVAAGGVQELLASVDAFVFDCDGVLYTPEGTIDGAADTLASLRNAGKRCFFVTNASTYTRVQLQAKLRGKGIEAEVSEIFGAAYLTASYLRRQELTGSVYVSGSNGLVQELRDACPHLAVLGGPEDDDRGLYDQAEMAAVEINPSICAVVLGMEWAPSFYKLAYSVRCLVSNNDEFCIKNEELCIENEEFCI